MVSPDRVFREAVEVWLSSRPDLLPDPAPTGEGAPAPDVVLIDSSFDSYSALTTAWWIREELPAAKALVLGLDREEHALDFIEAGALGYLLKGSSPDDLAATLRAVAAACTRCSARLAAAIMERIRELSALDTGRPRGPLPPLTPRELDILEAIACGLSNKEIGQRLRISVSTVKNHVHNVLEKLQVGHRREAIKLAYECGLLPAPGGSPAGQR